MDPNGLHLSPVFSSVPHESGMICSQSVLVVPPLTHVFTLIPFRHHPMIPGSPICQLWRPSRGASPFPSPDDWRFSRVDPSLGDFTGSIMTPEPNQHQTELMEPNGASAAAASFSGRSSTDGVFHGVPVEARMLWKPG